MAAIKKYQDKISGPLMDRIDMMVAVQAVPLKIIKSDSEEECSAKIRKRVEKTRERQRIRYRDERYDVNACLDEKGVEKYCHLKKEDKEWIEKIADEYELSYRGYIRILKLARTIADMDGSEQINKDHLTEAVMFRMGWQYDR